ncbi:MAG TPA: M67 family metallopeptidase [Terriglobia bacterium]|nr:M67 family metallopeptidase [Terriglobia bacterium]
MISIPQTLLREIYDHTEASYPHECCGLIVGTRSESGRHAHAFRTCRNLNTERAHDRYEMDPLCWVRVEAEFAKSSWDIIGIYHSHPDHPSRPSQTDTDAAWPDYSYIIVSVRQGTVASAQSWVLHEAERLFHEEPLVVDQGDRK